MSAEEVENPWMFDRFAFSVVERKLGNRALRLCSGQQHLTRRTIRCLSDYLDFRVEIRRHQVLSLRQAKPRESWYYIEHSDTSSMSEV